MIYLLDGFDHYGISANIAKKWTSASGNLKTDGRHGFGVTALLTHELSAPTTSLAAGRAAKFEMAGGPYISFLNQNGQQMASLKGLGDGSVFVQAIDPSGPSSSPSAVIMNDGQWYYLELACTVTLVEPGPPALYQLAYTARVNEYVALSGTLGPIAYGFGEFKKFHCGKAMVDDLWATDGELLGDCHVRAKYADADGYYSDFTPSTPGSHYVLVNEANPNTSTYLEASAVGQNESHGYPPSDDDDIRGIQVCLYCGPSLLSKLKPLLRSGSDVLGNQKTASGRYELESWRNSPFTGSAWSKAEVGNLETGAQATG